MNRFRVTFLDVERVETVGSLHEARQKLGVDLWETEDAPGFWFTDAYDAFVERLPAPVLVGAL